MSLLDNLPHICRIQIRSVTQDVLGGNREVRTTVQSGVPCWVQAMTSEKVMMYDKRGMIVYRNVYFADDPNLTELHEIVITSDENGAIATVNQVILEVVTDSRPDASAGLGVLFNVTANDRTGQRN